MTKERIGYCKFNLLPTDCNSGVECISCENYIKEQQPQEYKSAEEMLNKKPHNQFGLKKFYSRDYVLEVMHEFRNQGLRIPSDEEIKKESIRQSALFGWDYSECLSFRKGAKWFKSQITEQ